MGFSVMLWGAKKPVPAEYWCPYDTCFLPLNLYMDVKDIYIEHLI